MNLRRPINPSYIHTKIHRHKQIAAIMDLTASPSYLNECRTIYLAIAAV